MNHHRRSAQVWHVFSRDITVLPAHPHVHPQSGWAIPAFAFPAITGTHLPTPEGWKADWLSRPWCEVAQAEIRTCNFPIANPALYQWTQPLAHQCSQPCKNVAHIRFDHHAKFGCCFSLSVRACRRSQKVFGTLEIRPFGSGAWLIPQRNTLLPQLCYRTKFRGSRSNHTSVVNGDRQPPSLSRSLKELDRSVTYDFILVIHSNHGLSRAAVYKKNNSDIRSKTAKFSHSRCI